MMRKVFIGMVALIAFDLLFKWGAYVPQQWSGAIGGLMILAPIAGFIWLFVRFGRWHTSFHKKMVDGMMTQIIRDGLRPGRSSGEL